MSNVPAPQVQSSPTLQQIVGSSPNGSPSIDKTKASNKARKPRKRWVGQQLEKLESLFKVNQNPKSEDLDQLANELQSQVSDVKTWFQNRRAKEKKRGSPEVDITTVDVTKVTMHNVENGNTIPSPHLQTLTHTTIEHNIDPQQVHHQSQHQHHQHLSSPPTQHQLQQSQAMSHQQNPQHHSHPHHQHSQHQQHPQHQHLQQHQLQHPQHAQHQLHQSSQQTMQHQSAQHHQHQHQLSGAPPQQQQPHLSSQPQPPQHQQVLSHPPPPPHPTLQHQQSHPQSMQQHQTMQQQQNQSHLPPSAHDSLEACPSCAPYIDKLNLRIKELEDQCHQYQIQLFGTVPGPPPIPPTASPKRERDPNGDLLDESADKKLKRSLEPQRLFKKWANQVTRKIKGAKFFEAFGVPTAPVIIEEACTKEMFDACFETKGRLIQPTPDNKPYSTVTIRRYDTFEEVQDLFGDGNIVHAGHPAWVWRRNTVNTRSGEPRDVKLHRRTATIDSLEVHYNRNTMRLQLTFTCTLTPDNGQPGPKILPTFNGQPTTDHSHIPNTLPLPHSRLGLNFLPPSLRSLAPNLNSPARVDPIQNVQIDRTLINSINESLRMSHGDPNDPHAPANLASNLNPNMQVHNNLQPGLQTGNLQNSLSPNLQPNNLSHSLSPHNMQHNPTLHSSLQNLPPHNHMQGNLQVQANLQPNMQHSMQSLPSNLNMSNMNSLSPHLSSSTL